jgi:uncharacterized protein (TIGR04255 family)
MPEYRKPPITEAVIGTRFSAPLEPRVRERFRIKRQKVYPKYVELREFAIDGEKNSLNVTVRGHQLQGGNDSLDRAVLLPNEFNTARLAPYLGWDDLERKATENWEALLSIEPHPRLQTLSTRYINRIDIPVPMGSAPLRVGDYFRLGLSTPANLFKNGKPDFSITFIEYSADGRIKFKINFTTVIPMLIDHVSFTLDIDATTATDLPPRLSDAWDQIQVLHHAKNACFEALITDHARELFQ